MKDNVDHEGAFKSHLGRLHSLMGSNEWHIVFKASRFLSVVQKNMKIEQLGETMLLFRKLGPSPFARQFSYMHSHFS